MENAVSYTTKDGRVEIKLNYDPKHLIYEITVSDDGIGIPEEEQKEMFKLFHRGDDAVKVKPGGSGVGLYIAKEYVKLLNGELTYSSSPGRGATFKVTLPWVG